MRIWRLALPLAAILVAACTTDASSGSTPSSQPTSQPTPATSTPAGPDSTRWPLFGYDAARSNAFEGSTGIAATDLGRLRRQRVKIPGTADSSPIFVRGR